MTQSVCCKGCVAWKCGVAFILCWVFCAFCRCFFSTVPLLFSWFQYFSATWTFDVVASWNAASPSVPSFLHRFRLSSERFKSSTAHILGVEQVGLSEIVRHGLEEIGYLVFGRCWRSVMWLSLNRRMQLFSAHGAPPSNVSWICHFVRASCCWTLDTPMGEGEDKFASVSATTACMNIG